MATTFLHQAQRGASRGSIDLPLALLAALSIGFVAFMLPGDILAGIVETSRLPDFLPAAAPPLGAKARAVLAIAGAGATFAAVWLLLRTLGGRKPPEPKARDWADIDREPETPRLRRSDVHPDAPARRPILATRELGEPAPARAPEPVPERVAAPAEPEAAAPAEPEAAAPAPESDELELAGPGIEMLPEDVPVPEPAVEDPIVAVPVAPESPIAGYAPPPPEPEPVGDDSIAALMARLERGLARRRERHAAAPVPAAPAEGPASDHWGDDRLRSAIENLQKMAARAG